jgi:hypothetical protein
MFDGSGHPKNRMQMFEYVPVLSTSCIQALGNNGHQTAVKGVRHEIIQLAKSSCSLCQPTVSYSTIQLKIPSITMLLGAQH